MKRLKVFFTCLALTVGLVAAYSFTHTSASPATKPIAPDSEYVWIKYDCAVNGQVEEIPNGSNYIEADNFPSDPLFAACDGNQNVCAARFLISDTHIVPGTNNRVPDVAYDPLYIEKCQ